MNKGGFVFNVNKIKDQRKRIFHIKEGIIENKVYSLRNGFNDLLRNMNKSNKNVTNLKKATFESIFFSYK